MRLITLEKAITLNLDPKKIVYHKKGKFKYREELLLSQEELDLIDEEDKSDLELYLLRRWDDITYELSNVLCIIKTSLELFNGRDMTEREFAILSWKLNKDKSILDINEYYDSVIRINNLFINLEDLNILRSIYIDSRGLKESDERAIQ